MAAEAGDARERLDEYIEIRKLVDALGGYAEKTAPDRSDVGYDRSDVVDDQYLTIAEVTEDSITFGGDFGERSVGPVTVPPEIADMAETGWRILLSAVRAGGEWRLTSVVNGDPC